MRMKLKEIKEHMSFWGFFQVLKRKFISKRIEIQISSGMTESQQD
jgi:hypothetical protein